VRIIDGKIAAIALHRDHDGSFSTKPHETFATRGRRQAAGDPC
jgi:hypothetical protein